MFSLNTKQCETVKNLLGLTKACPILKTRLQTSRNRKLRVKCQSFFGIALRELYSFRKHYDMLRKEFSWWLSRFISFIFPRTGSKSFSRDINIENIKTKCIKIVRYEGWHYLNKVACNNERNKKFKLHVSWLSLDFHF